MSNSVEAISAKYLTAKKLSGGTHKEYKSTVTKWTVWGNGVDTGTVSRSAGFHEPILCPLHFKLA